MKLAVHVIVVLRTQPCDDLGILIICVRVLDIEDYSLTGRGHDIITLSNFRLNRLNRFDLLVHSPDKVLDFMHYCPAILRELFAFITHKAQSTYC